MVGFAIIALVILAAACIALAWAWYVKAPVRMGFIRTGVGGRKVMIDKGAIVIPGLHEVQWISLETFKLEVFKANREAFITKDRLRVDVGAEFYVKIPPDAASIERASRSLGDKSFSAEGIQSLVEEKLISALRSVAAQMELMQMHENRRGFALAVMENLREALVPNGLSLEDVSLYHLDQTERAQLDPNNIFDAEGLRTIAAQVSQRNRERNEIERNTEVAIKRKDVEAVKLKLQLDQEREFAEADQVRQVETNRTEQKAATEQFKFEQDRRTREAEIAKQQAIRQAEIEQEKAVREAELKRETYLTLQAQSKEQTEIAKDQAIQEFTRDKEIAILVKERQKVEEERRRLEAEALRERAAQEVVTVNEQAAAERAREVALVQARRELEVTGQKAQAMERMAQARLKEGEAEAQVRGKMREAENALEPKIIQRDIMLELLARAPQIVGELMAPAKQIESIRVLDVRGLEANGGVAGGGGGGGGAVDRVISSFLSAGAALPLLKELLDFARVDPETMVKKVAEHLPALREAMGPKA